MEEFQAIAENTGALVNYFGVFPYASAAREGYVYILLFPGSLGATHSRKHGSKLPFLVLLISFVFFVSFGGQSLSGRPRALFRGLGSEFLITFLWF